MRDGARERDEAKGRPVGLDLLYLAPTIILEDLPRASVKGSAARLTGSHLEWEFASDAIENLACDGHPSGGRCPFRGHFVAYPWMIVPL